ncbi:hypothetical protein ACH4PU_32820 [Streptomyces sp. NPDC021100]|uniref:hypothetical protein n=1 Tax=Streptomyces sp. NPDC021100 TaxID=3365114 RepID=UPI003787B046
MRLTPVITPDAIKPDSKWELTQGLDTIGVVERYDWPAGSRFAATPYELWTPGQVSGAPVPRFATLEEAAAAADELAEQRARTGTLKPVEVHRETYRDIEFVVTRHPATVTGRTRRHAHHRLVCGGAPAACPDGDIETVVKKVRARIDLQLADRELLPRLRLLVDSRPSAQGMSGWDEGAAPKAGDPAYVWARGMYRRGLVVDVARTRATVAYVTASNPGRVHRKADRFEELAAG